MIDRVIALLQQIQLDLNAEDIADALWLAQYLEAEEATVEVEELIAESAPIAEAPDWEPLPPLQTEFVPSEPKALIYPSEPVAAPLPAAPKPQGIPFQAPAAAALRTPLDLARSLRPLMRRVASRTNLVLDEEATAEEIADREVWSPVLRPDRERWLELAIVVEVSRSTAIWQPTIIEFQKLMEVQGAFRDVRTWSLTTSEVGKLQLFPRRGSVAVRHRTRSPKELIDPSGRRLILVVSDCISPLWRQGQIQPLLKQWSEAGPLAIVQLLPERLWVRSALGAGFPVQLSALSPGVANSKLQVDGLPIWEEINPATAIHLPVVTLEPEPLHQWARVVAGIGSTQTAGVVFDSSLLALQLQAESAIGSEQLSPEELVKRFRATASPTARKLAGLMAAAPVSLPVVNLLQETLLKDSRQIHVAEVFMSGLLEPVSEEAETVQYEFVNGVRDILLGTLPTPQVEAVLEAVSQYVASRAGLSIRNFAALLLPHPEWDSATRQAVLPFAEITMQVLKRLGGDYARVAEQLEQTAEGIAQRFREASLEPSTSPELRSSESEVATIDETDALPELDWKKQVARSLQEWMQAYLALEREYERSDQFADQPNAISQRVRSLRVRPGYSMEQVRAALNNKFASQNALAEAAAVTRSTVHEFLTGELVNRTTFEKLCRYLSLNPEEIADWNIDRLPTARLNSSSKRTLRVRYTALEQVKLATLRQFITQRALADHVQLSLDTINRFLNGKSVYASTFKEICRHLSLNLNEVADLVTDETSFLENLQLKSVYDASFHRVMSSLNNSIFQSFLNSLCQQTLSQELVLNTIYGQEIFKTLASEISASKTPKTLRGSRSLRVAPNFISQVKLAVRHNGFASQRALTEDLGLSLATVSNFLNGKPVDRTIFEDICCRLSLNWREIAELPTNDALAENSEFGATLAELLDTDFKFVPLSLAEEDFDRYPALPYRDTNTIQAVLLELHEASLSQLERLSSEQPSSRRQRRADIRLALSQAITGLAVILVSDTFLLPPYAALTLGCAGITQARDSLTRQPLQMFEFRTVKVDARGQQIESRRLTAQFYAEDLGNGVSLEMVAIPGGQFEMGSPANEPERRGNEGPQHTVRVAPFFMGKYPVTQSQWRVVASLPQVNRTLNLDPSRFKGDERPVERVNWYEAVEFCNRLSQHTGREYRLPTEAEWEYACRSGTTTPFYFGETITSDLANYRGTSTYRGEPEGDYRIATTSSGTFPPNEFGLFDMYGNVWEWCADHWHDSYEGAPTNGSAWLSNDENAYRVLRGGSWSNLPQGCRSAYRYDLNPDIRVSIIDGNIGFRVVCSAPRTQ